MEQKELINVVSKELKTIYEKYSAEGMLACYIWGSLTTPDYNPVTSDIDTIAIVNDNIPIELEKTIQNELNSKYPELWKFGFRFLYKSELATGKMKSFLGRVAGAKSLILDLPTWKWVCGTQFTQKDFATPVPTLQEALGFRDKRFKKDGWYDTDSVKPEAIQYFIKQILRGIFIEQLIRDNRTYELFSYSRVKEYAKRNEEEAVVTACLKVKASNWKTETFNSYKELFALYVSKIKDKIS